MFDSLRLACFQLYWVILCIRSVFFFQAEDGIRDLVRSRGLGDVYKRQQVDFARAGALGAGMVAFAFLTAASRIASRIWIFNAARGAEYDLRSDLFGHMMTLSPAYYRDHPVGDVMSRLTNDVQTVRAMWGFGLVSLGNAILAFISVLGVMLGAGGHGHATDGILERIAFGRLGRVVMRLGMPVPGVIVA